MPGFFKSFRRLFTELRVRFNRQAISLSELVAQRVFSSVVHNLRADGSRRPRAMRPRTHGGESVAGAAVRLLQSEIWSQESIFFRQPRRFLGWKTGNAEFASDRLTEPAGWPVRCATSASDIFPSSTFSSPVHVCQTGLHGSAPKLFAGGRARREGPRPVSRATSLSGMVPKQRKFIFSSISVLKERAGCAICAAADEPNPMCGQCACNFGIRFGAKKVCLPAQSKAELLLLASLGHKVSCDDF